MKNLDAVAGPGIVESSGIIELSREMDREERVCGSL